MALTPSAYDPSCGLTYAQWLQGKGVQTRPGGWSHATRDQVREGVDEQGRRYKCTLDQLGHEQIETTDPPGSATPGKQRLHARIHLPA